MKQLAILLLVIGMLLPCFSNEETPKKRFFKKAGSELIIGTKIAFQLHKELKAFGISSVELLKEVKKNPKKFLVSVPYHERTRIIAFLPEHDQIISKKAFDDYKNLTTSVFFVLILSSYTKLNLLDINSSSGSSPNNSPT